MLVWYCDLKWLPRVQHHNESITPCTCMVTISLLPSPPICITVPTLLLHVRVLTVCIQVPRLLDWFTHHEAHHHFVLLVQCSKFYLKLQHMHCMLLWLDLQCWYNVRNRKKMNNVTTQLEWLKSRLSRGPRMCKKNWCVLTRTVPFS